MNDIAQTQNILQLVLVILSIGTVIGPVFFGFVLFRMTKVFITQERFADYKLLADTQRAHMLESQARIERKVDELLERDQ